MYKNMNKKLIKSALVVTLLVITCVPVLTSAKVSNLSSASSTTRFATSTITKSPRTNALVGPQKNIIAAANRSLNIISMLNIVGTKIRTRLASDQVASTSTTTKSMLTDFSTKIAHASTTVQAVIVEVSSLKPDNGDKNVFLSNLAILKDARLKIQIIQQDFVSARRDIRAIVNILKENSTSTKVK